MFNGVGIGHDEPVTTRDRRYLMLVRALVATAIAGVLLLLALPQAQAHSTLIGADPPDGAVLEQPPARVTLRFDEPLRIVRDGVEVFTASGRPVPVTASSRDAVVRVTLPAALPDGTYTVTWRVVSADGDPVTGSLRFSVRVASATVTAPGMRGDAPGVVSALLAGSRALLYAGLLGAAGLGVFRGWIGTLNGPPERRLRLRRGVVAAALLAYAGGLLSAPLTVMVQEGESLAALARTRTWLAADPTTYAALAAIFLGLACAVVAVSTAHRAGVRAVRLLAALGVALPAGALALTGHSRAFTPHALVVTVDVVHVAAGMVWVGGLLGLVLIVPGMAAEERREVLKRFSVTAAGSVAVLVTAGALLAWRIADSWDLLATAYGRLLLAKVDFVLIALAYAAVNRQLVRSDRGGRVGRELRIEALVLVGVLALTAVLVSQAPRATAPMPEEQSASTR